MIISDIQAQGINIASFSPDESTIGVLKPSNTVAAIDTDGKMGSSTTGSDSSATHDADDGTKVTLSSQQNRTGESGATEKQAADQPENKNQQQASAEYTIKMSGIPLSGGKLISVVSYPDGRSEIFDVFSGKRLTPEDIAALKASVEEDDVTTVVEPATGDDSLSAAEIYQQIQQMLNGRGTAAS